MLASIDQIWLWWAKLCSSLANIGQSLPDISQVWLMSMFANIGQISATAAQFWSSVGRSLAPGATFDNLCTIVRLLYIDR